MNSGVDMGLGRRRIYWYDAYRLNGVLQLMAGSLFVCVFSCVFIWGAGFFRHFNPPEVTALVAIELCFLIATLILRRLGNFPGSSYIANVFPIVTVVFLFVLAVILFARLRYSRPLLLSGFVMSLIWCLLSALAAKRYLRMKVVTLPLGRCKELRSNGQFEVHQLARPDTGGMRFDAVVADFDAGVLGNEWERFLANCALNRIPVYHVRRIEEALTGRVSVEGLTANEAGNLLPSPLYVMGKRAVDLLGALVALPVALPLMALVAIAVRLDSKGPALFIQERVGRSNKSFMIYKFRSMYASTGVRSARFARLGDDRITRVGRFIRKARLDELPQLLNVLRGDMSLIGPRPEQRAFVNQFTAEIPFYAYRHVVHPGITGWAQVTQGYAGDIESNRMKIQYDLYYIKHFSLWLDVLIMLKTIKIVLTGHGAR